jgi:hypothetical protein
LNITGKVIIPRNKCQEFSKIFNEGSVIFGKTELSCNFLFKYDIYFNGMKLESLKSLSVIKNVDQYNVQLFMKSMRIQG